MKIEQNQSELARQKKLSAILMGFNAMAMVIGIFLVIALTIAIYFQRHHEVHFIPPKVSGEFSISNAGVSESYLRDMTSFLTQLRFNVTASSAIPQFNILLGYVSPEFYGAMRAQMLKETEKIKHEHLSAVFYPNANSFEIDTKNLKVKLKGQMKRFVGADLMSEKEESYLIGYSFDAGLLKLVSIEKVK